MKKDLKLGGKRKVRFADETVPDKMTKDKQVTVTKKPRDHGGVGEDVSRMVSELTPGKKGGDFPLSFGGMLSVPQGTMGKRDVITVCQVSPSDRHKYLPPLQNGEKLLSEIYLLGSNVKSLRKPLQLRLPVFSENQDLFDVTVLIKKTDSDEWENKEFIMLDNDRYVEVNAETTGIFTVISAPKRDRFEIPVQGCLYNARIHRNISVRFAKKATDVDMHCDITITPLNTTGLAALRRDFPHDMADLVVASDFYDIKPSIAKEFKRAATVKLPLPPLDEEEFSEDDLVVMEMTYEGWKLFEGQLKFTKGTVSFDTKRLSKYCIALARPNRKRKLTDAFRHLQDENDITRGEILPFIHIKEKSWTLWLDCVPMSRVDDVINKRLREGFRVIKKTEGMEEEESEEQPVFRRHWKSRARPVEPTKTKRPELELSNGAKFEIHVGGDIRVCRDDPSRGCMHISYHEMLPNNYRKFKVEPLPVEESKTITCIIRCYLGEESSKCVRTYDFDIEPEAVADYFYVEPEPEPEPEPEIKEPEDVIETKPEPVAPAAPPKPERFTTPMTQSFMRLIKPTRAPVKISRESKVLTGRSLMCLARQVEQGLTLAIYLDISDSAITGMGFDALATGLSLVDITYRILLLWKRRTTKFKGDRQVNMLASAFEDMGRNDCANVLLEQHKLNKEITPECFIVE